MFKFTPIACALCAALISAPAVQANTAQTGFVEDSGASQRIDLSGKLRMLSQRIPAAACALRSGVAPDESRALLENSVNEFNAILFALEFGNDDMGVFGAEERPRTLRVIQEVHAKFDPIQTALNATADGVPSDEAIQILADQNGAVLEMAKLLVVEISGQYSNPVALLQSDAMAIDIAGRQRMLTQKVSKDVCQIATGVNPTSSREALSGTVQIFEASLGALRNGMESVGLEQPPTEEIAAGLDRVQADWMEVKAHIDAVDAGEAISDEERAVVFVGLNKTMADMNKVVGMYSEASKLGY